MASDTTSEAFKVIIIDNDTISEMVEVVVIAALNSAIPGNVARNVCVVTGFRISHTITTMLVEDIAILIINTIVMTVMTVMVMMRFMIWLITITTTTLPSSPLLLPLTLSTPPLCRPHRLHRLHPHGQARGSSTWLHVQPHTTVKHPTHERVRRRALPLIRRMMLLLLLVLLLLLLLLLLPHS